MPEAASTTSGVADNAAIPSGLDACAGCHTLRAGQPHDMGPNLWNIYDREIASFLDYDYSPALKSRGGTWGDDELRAFLADPDSFAAGTKMTPQDLSEQEIAEAIAALKALR
jgi:cytochrome c